MLGGAGLGCGKQRRVMYWEIAVVVLQDGQSCPLDTAEEMKRKVLAKGSYLIQIPGSLMSVLSTKNQRGENHIYQMCQTTGRQRTGGWTQVI